MIKKILIAVLCVGVVAGCAGVNPPQAPIAKGEWIPLNTTVLDVRY